MIQHMTPAIDCREVYSSVARYIGQKVILKSWMRLIHIRIVKDSCINNDMVNPIKVPYCRDLLSEALTTIRMINTQWIEASLATILASDDTSHNKSWQLARGAEPARIQS